MSFYSEPSVFDVNVVPEHTFSEKTSSAIQDTTVPSMKRRKGLDGAPMLATKVVGKAMAKDEVVGKAVAKDGVYDKHLWYIHGNAYDLSQFVPKHPGGQFAIKSARGRECTALFESYHPWNDKHRKVLAAYGAKPPPCDPFYEELKVGVRKLFPGGAKQTKVRTSALIGLWTGWAILMYLFFVVQTVPACLLAGLLVGFIVTRLSHEASHFQASNMPWLNRMMLFVAYLPVGHSLCWYYRHVISHHPHTNTESDVDVRYIKMVDMLPSCLNFAKVLSIPGIFAGAVAELSIIQSLEMFITGNVEGNPVYYSVGGLVPEAVCWVALHYMFGPSLLGYACMFVMAGAVFVPCSQVSHAILYPEPNLDASWAKGQIQTAVNFAPRSSLWYHLAFGLTTQIDHHLFPSIAAHCYDDIHEQVVKPICAKHQVPCYELSAQKAFSALWQRLLTGKAVRMLG